VYASGSSKTRGSSTTVQNVFQVVPCDFTETATDQELLLVQDSKHFQTASTESDSKLHHSINMACMQIVNDAKNLVYERVITVVTNGVGVGNLIDIEQRVSENLNIRFEFLFIDCDHPQSPPVKAFFQGLSKQSNVIFFDSFQALKHLRLEHVKPVSGYPVSFLLDVGNGHGFHIKLAKKTVEAKPDSLKKYSTISDQEVKSSKVYKKEGCYEAMDEESLVKGYWYGGTLIPFNDGDVIDQKFKTGVRSLKVIGYVDKSTIPIHISMGDAAYLIPRDGLLNSQSGFRIYVTALNEANKLCIARLVSRQDASVKVVALVPYMDNQVETLIVWELPFAEDVRQFVFSSLEIKPAGSQIQAMEALVDGMSLDASKYAPEQLLNPFLERYYQILKKRSLKPDAEYENDPIGDEYLPSNMTLPVYEEVKSLFPLKQVVDAKRARDELESVEPLTKQPKIEADTTSAWVNDLSLSSEKNASKKVKQEHNSSDDWMKEKTNDDDWMMEGDAKEIKPCKSEDDWMEEGDAKGETSSCIITDVLTSDELDTKFMSIIEIGDDQTTKSALEEMRIRIDKFLADDSNQENVVKCLRSLRVGCIRTQNEHFFNHFLAAIKRRLFGDSDWKQILQAHNIHLIHETVNGVSNAESEAFYE